MGFGTSAANIILFIATLIVATSVAAVLGTTTHKITIGLQAKEELLTKALSSDIEIINDPVVIPKQGNYYLFYVKNIGKEKILFDSTSLSVLIDGQLIPAANLTVTSPGNQGYLSLADVGTIGVMTNLTSGDHTIKVITYEGASDSLDFRI
jgi:flagellar protein FlaG